MSAQKVTLPSGKQVKMHNGDRGFIARSVLTLKCTEGFKQFLPWKYLELADKLVVGKRGMDIFPDNLDVSKQHATVACVNNYYFLKDASKMGSYVKLTSGQNKRIELHKGMAFSVGRIGLKVQMIEGDAADNREIKKEIAAAEAAKAEKRGSEDAKNKGAELESDEEFADTDDDDDDASSKTKSGKRGKLDGPAVMFLVSVDKKGVNVKGRIRETSTIGSDKDKNKISIPLELAKQKAVSTVHTRIVLEDGHFYLEDAGSSFGTWVGLPKKRFFELNSGDRLMFGGARCRIAYRLSPIQPLQGLVDKILGTMPLNTYAVTILGAAPIEQRLNLAFNLKKVKDKRDDD